MICFLLTERFVQDTGVLNRRPGRRNQSEIKAKRGNNIQFVDYAVQVAYDLAQSQEAGDAVELGEDQR